MTEVVDTSALILACRHPGLRSWVRDRGDEIAVVDVVALEYLMERARRPTTPPSRSHLGGFVALRVEVVDWDRARDVHRSLAALGPGHQRSVRIPNLLIAAVAERNRMAIAHYDEDYDRIAAVTGQPARWVLPRGTV